MSITLNLKMAAKAGNYSEKSLFNGRDKGNFKKGPRVTDTTNALMENLDVFGDYAQVVRDNVTKDMMFVAVRRLLTDKTVSEVIVYQFPTERASKSGL